MRVWDAKDISDDLNNDEEPPPAPTAVVDEGLEKELEKLENSENAEDFQETPEDGIIEDDVVEETNEKEADDIKSVAASSVNAEDQVLTSG